MDTQRATRLLILGGSLLVSLCCWLDVPAVLRGLSRHHQGWQWKYYDPRQPVGIALCLAAFATIALLLQRLAPKRWLASALALSACALALQLAIVGLTRDPRGHPWVPLMQDGVGTVYFPGIEEWRDLRPMFREWPRLRDQLPPPHFPYHPPFALLPAWVSQRLCEDQPKFSKRLSRATGTRKTVSRAVEAAAPLLSALLVCAAAASTSLFTTPLLRARADPTPIVGAAVCAALPALLTHSPTLDQLQVPLFAAAALLAHVLQLPFAGLVAGACVGLAAELSFVSLALGNFVAVLVCLRARAEQRPRLALSAAMVALGALLVLLVGQLATGFSWIAGLVTILQGGHPELKLQRAYLSSLWRNVFDVLVWCGPLAVVGLVGGGISALRGLFRREPSIDALPLAVIAALGILYFSGAIRAEAGRIWMPYFPILVMAALPTLRRLLPGRWLWLGGLVQLLHTWVVLTKWGI